MHIADSAKSRDRLKAAVGCGSALSREGFLEHLFAWMFKGLVYPQIWEDPEIDLEALAVTPDSHVVAIASGGCNILSYLIADPQRITAVGLNKTHVALCRLKLSAAENLPGWDSFYRFFGEADERANVNAYWRFLSAALDSETRAYWEGRSAFGFGRRRISLFSRNFYRHGRVAEGTLSRWYYEAEQSRDYTARDRSAIYGGFHLYVFKG